MNDKIPNHLSNKTICTNCTKFVHVAHIIKNIRFVTLINFQKKRRQSCVVIFLVTPP